MCGFYHQDERDEAAGRGFLTIVAIAVIGMILAIVLACMSAADMKATDGSNSGTNTVTAEELEVALDGQSEDG